MPDYYLVWGDDISRDPDDPIEIDAYDEEEAACEATEMKEQDDCEYSVADGSIIRLFVKKDKVNAEIKQFQVSGEFEPRYRATEYTDQEVEIITKMENDGYRYDAHWGEFRKKGSTFTMRELKRKNAKDSNS